MYPPYTQEEEQPLLRRLMSAQPYLQTPIPQPVQTPPAWPTPNPVNLQLAPELPIEQEYKSLLAQRPVQTQPRLADRILNALQSASAAWQEGPTAGVKLAQQLTNAPYQRQMADWQSRMQALEPVYKMESDRFGRSLKGYELGLDLSKFGQKVAHETALEKVAERRATAQEAGVDVQRSRLELEREKEKDVKAWRERQGANADKRIELLKQEQHNKQLPMETAATLIAKENNVPIDPEKPVLDQLRAINPKLAEDAIKRASQYGKDPITHMLAQAHLDDVRDRMAHREEEVAARQNAADEAIKSIEANPRVMYDVLKQLDPKTKTQVIGRLRNPMGVHVTGRAQTRLQSSEVAIDVGQSLMKIIDDPEIAGSIGPLWGRILKGEEYLGNLTEKQAWVANKLLYLQANEAGSFTATGGASKYILAAFSKPAADLRQTRENLRGALMAAVNHALEYKKIELGGLSVDEEQLFKESNPFRAMFDKTGGTVPEGHTVIDGIVVGKPRRAH